MRKISKFMVVGMMTAAIPTLAIDEFILTSPGSRLRFQTQGGNEVTITCQLQTRDGKTMAQLEAELQRLTDQLAENRRACQEQRRQRGDNYYDDGYNGC